MPPKVQRSVQGLVRTLVTGRKKQGAKKSAALPVMPQIFVKVRGKAWQQNQFVPAAIKLRRKCYRYLVWNEDGRRREFYLGKVKILAPADRELAELQTSAPAIAIERARGGKKR